MFKSLIVFLKESFTCWAMLVLISADVFDCNYMHGWLHMYCLVFSDSQIISAVFNFCSLIRLRMSSLDVARADLALAVLYLNKAEARDKICRAIQYGSKFLSNGEPGTAQNVDKSTSLARKVFRLFKVRLLFLIILSVTFFWQCSDNCNSFIWYSCGFNSFALCF